MFEETIGERQQLGSNYRQGGFNPNGAGRPSQAYNPITGQPIIPSPPGTGGLIGAGGDTVTGAGGDTPITGAGGD